MQAMNVHSCRQMYNYWPLGGSCRIYIFIDDEINDWVLKYEETDTLQEVRSGEAEYEGELLMSHSFVIKFCPYCGQKLNHM